MLPAAPHLLPAEGGDDGREAFSHKTHACSSFAAFAGEKFRVFGAIVLNIGWVSACRPEILFWFAKLAMCAKRCFASSGFSTEVRSFFFLPEFYKGAFKTSSHMKEQALAPAGIARSMPQVAQM